MAFACDRKIHNYKSTYGSDPDRRSRAQPPGKFVLVSGLFARVFSLFQSFSFVPKQSWLILVVQYRWSFSHSSKGVLSLCYWCLQCRPVAYSNGNPTCFFCWTLFKPCYFTWSFSELVFHCTLLSVWWWLVSVLLSEWGFLSDLGPGLLRAATSPPYTGRPSWAVLHDLCPASHVSFLTRFPLALVLLEQKIVVLHEDESFFSFWIL